jgi:hypothetical protein
VITSAREIVIALLLGLPLGPAALASVKQGGPQWRDTVKAYLHAKMAQAEISPALYRIASELDARELIDGATRRSAKAIEAMLSSTGISELQKNH